MTITLRTQGTQCYYLRSWGQDQPHSGTGEHPAYFSRSWSWNRRLSSSWSQSRDIYVISSSCYFWSTREHFTFGFRNRNLGGPL